MRGEFLYANGMTIATGRKIFKFYFGDFYIEAKRDERNLRFDIFVRDKILSDNKQILRLKDLIDVDYFIEYWNPSIAHPVFKVFVVETQL